MYWYSRTVGSGTPSHTQHTVRAAQYDVLGLSETRSIGDWSTLPVVTSTGTIFTGRSFWDCIYAKTNIHEKEVLHVRDQLLNTYACYNRRLLTSTHIHQERIERRSVKTSTSN